jgi:hypothetical protein
MAEAAHPAARVIATRLQDYFHRYHVAARAEGDLALAPEPDVPTIEAMVDAAFWASLRREEGYTPRISLAFVAPAQVGTALSFARPIPLAPDLLTRLAAAAERPGIHLGVWRGDQGLEVWGATRTIPSHCLVLETVAAGLVVVKHRRLEGSGKFLNLAVIEGDRVKIIDELGTNVLDCPALVASLLGFDAPATWSDTVNVLVELALSMRDHRRGGTLLVVNHGTDGWLDSVVRPIAYAIEPAYGALAALMRDRAAHGSRAWHDALRRHVEGVAGLTAVDGATILTDQYDVLAFGAKIVRRRGAANVEQVVLTEPIEGVVPEIVHPSALGGTRHLSAAQFAHDEHGAVALVASQDGRFTVFAWSPCDSMVHAHRVDVLLL